MREQLHNRNENVSEPKNKTTLARVAVLGFPLLFAQLTHYLHQVADSAMLGHFGEGSEELAAVGIAGLFTWILNTLLWPLSNGVQAITARRFGRQMADDAQAKIFTGEALDNGIITAVYASIVALIVSFLARPILSVLIQTEEILELTLAYIGIMRLALLPTGIFFVLQGFLGAINKTSYVMWAGIISNVLNVILNYLLIYGVGELPAMGIRGAAWGTAISWLVSSIFLLIVIFSRSYAKNYRLLTFRHLGLQLQKNIVMVSLPPAVQNVIALALFMIYQTIIEDYSAVHLAATHVAFSFFRLNKTIIGGFARSAGILAGNALGRNDRVDAKKLSTSAGLIATGVALIIALVTIVSRHGIAAIFTSDPQTQATTAMALLFFIPFFFVESLGYVFEMIFVVNGYGRYVLISEFVTNMIFILGGTLLARLLSPDEVRLAWFSFGLYQIIHALFMISGYFRGKWLEVEVESTQGA